MNVTLNHLDAIEDNIMDVVSHAEQSDNSIEAINKNFKSLIQHIFQLFHEKTNSGFNEEQVNQKLKQILQEYLEQNQNKQIYDYSTNSLPNMSSKEVLATMFVLLFSQKLFSIFILYLMSNKHTQEIYQQNAFMRNIDQMNKLKKLLQYFESKNIKIHSKWIEHYQNNQTLQRKRTLKNGNSPVDQVKKSQQNFWLKNHELFKDLPEDDPIKIWYTNKSNFGLEFLNQIQSAKSLISDNKSVKERNFMKSKISDQDQKQEAPLSPTQFAPRKDSFFKALIDHESKNKQNQNHFMIQLSDDDNETKQSQDENIYPSQKIFENKYKNIFNQKFLYLDHHIQTERPPKCQLCDNILRRGFFSNEGTFCYVVGKWCCDNCISTQKYIIPSLILNKCDYSFFKISKEAEKYFIDNYSIPYFKFQQTDEQILSEKMIQFIFLRKQLHLMLDAICNEYIITEVFRSRENLLIKQVFLSLKDLTEIENQQIINFTQTQIQIFGNHFNQCEKCQKKVQTCYGCQLNDIFLWDIFHSKICKKCKKLFHRTCLESEEKCPSCLSIEKGYQLIYMIIIMIIYYIKLYFQKQSIILVIQRLLSSLFNILI